MASFTGTQTKCKICSKTVYLVDQVTVDSQTYHKACFRCNHCKSTLKLGNMALYDGVLYCKPHFEQLFKQTGSYEKSFEGATLGSGKPVDASANSGGSRVVTSGSPAVTPKVRSTAAPSKLAGMFGGTQEKCHICTKTVYPLEKVTCENNAYHKVCFKCVHGGCTITTSNYAALEGRLYCKAHYSQLFKEKGNYSALGAKPAPAAGAAPTPAAPVVATPAPEPVAAPAPASVPVAVEATADMAA